MKVVEVNTKFDFGDLCATKGFMDKVHPAYAFSALAEHLQGHWGCIDDEDWQANNAALQRGGRILSAYPMLESEDIFWIITEADRSVTTFLLPSEY
jgi:hypothetical protein